MALSDSNYYGRVLKALFERLQSEVPELLWIAEDIGQLDETELRPSVSFPCALIDFPNSTYTSDSGSIRTGDVTISVRLAFDPYANAYEGAPNYSLDKSLERFEIEHKVVSALHDYGVEDLFSELQCVQQASDKRNDGMRVRSLTLTTSYKDQVPELNIVKGASLKVKIRT